MARSGSAARLRALRLEAEQGVRDACERGTGCAARVVDAVAIAAVRHAGIVDVLHDLPEPPVHLLRTPALARSRLCHFELGDRHAAGVRRLARAEGTPSSRKRAPASSSVGMLAPSQTNRHPLSMRRSESPSSSSFWVAHGKAASQATCQARPSA